MKAPLIALWTCATCLFSPAATAGIQQFVTNTVTEILISPAETHGSRPGS